mgnify:CR=1 FL=1
MGRMEVIQKEGLLRTSTVLKTYLHELDALDLWEGTVSGVCVFTAFL